MSLLTFVANGCFPHRKPTFSSGCGLRSSQCRRPRLVYCTPRASLASPQKVDVLIIGGGLSGTALAHELSKTSDLDVLLTESRDRIGGNVISCEDQGYIWEEGPNTFQPAAHIMRLAVDVGLRDDIVLADGTLPRFVYWDKNLFALPLSPKEIPTFRLLSLPGAIRAALGAMGLVLPNNSGKEESVKGFITRHLGKEVFERMIDPFVSGVYAGDPSKLSMSAAFKKIYALEQLGFTLSMIEGAIVRLQQKKKEEQPLDPDLPKWKPGMLGSFRQGLAMLPQAVVKKLPPGAVQLSWTLRSLTKRDDGSYFAVYDTPSGEEGVITASVAVTSPASATGKIFSELAPGTKALDDLHYPCVWSVSLAYPKSEFRQPLRGFGNLNPRSMGVRTLGTIWSSCLFPGRAPEGMELLLSYIGGAKDPEIANLTQEEVTAAVDRDIKKILMKEGSTVKPVVLGARKWPRAIPQYNIGYFETMEKVKNALEPYPGIFLGGNYVSGVAIGDCIMWGQTTAKDIVQYVKESTTKEVATVV